MSYCPNCCASVKGKWITCPLCQTSLVEAEEKTPNPTMFLNPPLRFDRKNIVKAFLNISWIVVLIYFIVQFIWPFQFFGLEYILFGLMITWLCVLILVGRRRNIVKGMMYLLVLFSLVSVYFDYSDRIIDWSITFTLPILSISAIVAMFIAIQFVKLKTEDYVLYLQLTTMVGTIPLLFLVMGWVHHPLPSIASTLVSISMFWYVFIKHRIKIKAELKKRMHI